MRYVLGLLLELGGAAALVYGVWLIFPPAAFITGFVVAWVFAWRVSP